MAPAASTRSQTMKWRKQRKKKQRKSTSSMARPNNCEEEAASSNNNNIYLVKKKKKKKEDEIEDENGIIIISSSTSSSSECSTPKGKRFRIPEVLSCPPPPKKTKVLPNPSNCSSINNRLPIPFFASPDIEFFFSALTNANDVSAA